MTVSAEWAQRNLGLQNLAPRPAADEMRVADADASLQRELIDYDSQGATRSGVRKESSLGRAGTVALRAHPVAEGPGAKGRLGAGWGLTAEI